MAEAADGDETEGWTDIGAGQLPPLHFDLTALDHEEPAGLRSLIPTSRH